MQSARGDPPAIVLTPQSVSAKAARALRAGAGAGAGAGAAGASAGAGAGAVSAGAAPPPWSPPLEPAPAIDHTSPPVEQAASGGQDHTPPPFWRSPHHTFPCPAQPFRGGGPARPKCPRSTLSPLRSCRVWLHLQGRGREAGAGGQDSLVAGRLVRGRRTGSCQASRTAGAAGGQRRDVQSQPGSATTTRGPASAAATERATGLFQDLMHLLLCGSAHRRLLHSPATATSRPPTPPTLPTPPTRPAPSAGSHSAPAAWCRSATASTSSTTAAPLCG